MWFLGAGLAHLAGALIEAELDEAALLRLRQNNLQLAAGMNGVANRAEALQSEGGLASAQFRFDTPQVAAGSFIKMIETTDQKFIKLRRRIENDPKNRERC